MYLPCYVVGDQDYFPMREREEGPTFSSCLSLGLAKGPLFSFITTRVIRGATVGNERKGPLLPLLLCIMRLLSSFRRLWLPATILVQCSYSTVRTCTLQWARSTLDAYKAREHNLIEPDCSHIVEWEKQLHNSRHAWGKAYNKCFITFSG